MAKKKKRRSLISLAAILICIVISVIAVLLLFQVVPQDPFHHARWVGYPHLSGFYSANNSFAKPSGEPKGGLRLLPPQYVETTMTVIYDEVFPTLSHEEKIALLNSLPEFSPISIIPDKQKSVWYVAIGADEACWSKTDYHFSLDNCAIRVATYDLSKKTITQTIKIQQRANQQAHFLVQDEARGILWFDVTTDGDAGPQTDSLLSVNINQGTYSFLPFSQEIDHNDNGWIGDKSAVVSKDGTIYTFVTSPHGSDLAAINPTTGQSLTIPIDPQAKDIWIADAEMTIDKDANKIYLATFTWDGNTPTRFYTYDINRKQMEDIGTIPTSEDDDVRGFTFYKGRLLAGFFAGLGVYNPQDKQWKVYTQKDGLLQTPVRDIYITANGGLCVNHDDQSMSCLAHSLQ